MSLRNSSLWRRQRFLLQQLPARRWTINNGIFAFVWLNIFPGILTEVLANTGIAIWFYNQWSSPQAAGICLVIETLLQDGARGQHFLQFRGSAPLNFSSMQDAHLYPTLFVSICSTKKGRVVFFFKVLYIFIMYIHIHTHIFSCYI